MQSIDIRELGTHCNTPHHRIVHSTVQIRSNAGGGTDRFISREASEFAEADFVYGNLGRRGRVRDSLPTIFGSIAAVEWENMTL